MLRLDSERTDRSQRTWGINRVPIFSGFFFRFLPRFIRGRLRAGAAFNIWTGVAETFDAIASERDFESHGLEATTPAPADIRPPFGFSHELTCHCGESRRADCKEDVGAGLTIASSSTQQYDISLARAFSRSRSHPVDTSPLLRSHVSARRFHLSSSFWSWSFIACLSSLRFQFAPARQN